MNKKLDLDSFGELIDEFLEKVEGKMLITMLEGTQKVIVEDNIGAGSVVQFYFMLQAISSISKAIRKEMALDFQDGRWETVVKGILRIMEKEMLEGGMGEDEKICKICGQERGMMSWETICFQCAKEKHLKEQQQAIRDGDDSYIYGTETSDSDGCIFCPYCGERTKTYYGHEDFPELYEEGFHKIECPICEKEFELVTDVSFSWETRKVGEDD
ncbi:MAG: hypothetical protein LUE92_04635 [Clostridiales bacterium]|nr:hypothetical protein [Clostridiales bacterium]